MNAVVTICIGEVYDKIGKFTHPSIERYAEKIGADFIVIDKTNRSSPHWEKFQIFQFLNKYERIIFLDSDLIVREDCPNLFDVVPPSKLGAFNELPFTENRQESLYQACKDYEVNLKSWNGKYYNTGVLVISRIHKYLFKKPDKETFNFYEQGYLNMIFAKELRTNESYIEGIVFYDLPYKFNRMACMDRFTGEERHGSYIVHYAGFPSLSFVLDLIPRDLEKWEKTKPDYKYRQHLLINVNGGLGDQIDAEPAIRYLKDQVFPGADIHIQTHFPKVFSHLGLPVYLHGDFRPEPDTPYYSVMSMPGPDKVHWSVVSNLLCHTVDYCSIALLRRTLPFKDKQTRLTVAFKDIANVLDIVGVRKLDELVLVHPGKHWPSKTFPVEWWQEVVDGIQKNGRTVCLIGYEDDSRGTVPIEVRKGVIDTRNLLDLGALFALISQCKVLVSNDSAPVHIAGAFDNWIILIPSCKHPDHVLPYRHESVSYKTSALYKKLTLDAVSSKPTEVHGQEADFVVGDILDYIPEPKEVIDEVEKVMKGEVMKGEEAIKLKSDQLKRNLRTAVVTICIGDFYKELSEITHPKIKNYAEKIGADFISLSGTGLSVICYEKFQLRAMLQKYDRILYIDSDALVSPNAPNIFDVVPEEMMGFLNESPLGYDNKFIDFLREHGSEYLEEWSKHRKCYNAGIFVCSKQHRDVFKLPEVLVNHYQEQSYLNLRLLQEKVKVFDLPYQYNHMIYLDLVIKEHRLKSYFIHYAGFLENRPIEECKKFLEKEYEMLLSQDFSKDDVKIAWG